jgi:dimethylsulfone monooxygenase
MIRGLAARSVRAGPNASSEFETRKLEGGQMSSGAIVREAEAEVKRELERVTDVKQNALGFANSQQWLNGTQLEQRMSIEEYSGSNRGLRSGLTETPSQVQDRLGEFETAGVNLVLLQFSPQLEEMERFAESVISAPVPA